MKEDYPIPEDMGWTHEQLRAAQRDFEEMYEDEWAGTSMYPVEAPL